VNNFWGFLIWRELFRRNRRAGSQSWFMPYVVLGLLIVAAYYIAVTGEYLGLWHR